MRKTMTREITRTTIKIAQMSMEDGTPVAVALDDDVMLGNIKIERAQREVQKKHDSPVTVLQVIPETTVYEMPIETFIDNATVKQEEQN